MELKVWVEGIQRIVCGVTVNTTCQDVVFALAHATGKVGRFTLIERWRNNERLLAPSENPLKILLKWGEYASDVQFILQRSDQLKKDGQRLETDLESTSHTDFLPLDRAKELRKSFGLEPKPTENIGIVKGVPQQQETPSFYAAPSSTLQMKSSSHQKTPSSISLPEDTLHKRNEINLASVRNSLDRKTTANNNNIRTTTSLSSDNLLDAFNGNSSNGITSDLFKNGPQISSNGALVPPPYRDPPPPRNSPLQTQQQSPPLNQNVNNNPFLIGEVNNDVDFNENFFQNAHYKDLIQLIKYQRDKITLQQAELNKYDAEIVYLENKERDQAQELETISREITKTDLIFRQGNEQLQSLQYVEEENELVKQQEKTLKSEITLLRSKLANCETELLQCKNKMRLLMDDIQIEQKGQIVHKKDTRQNVEREFLGEMERIQTEIDHAIHNTDSSNKATDNLKKEISLIEKAIAEKKRQVELLVNEMKEVNLQSLTVGPSDEIRHLLEGSNRPGSTRRIIGSPRQLENAVPTSKNPHGVWV